MVAGRTREGPDTGTRGRAHRKADPTPEIALQIDVAASPDVVLAALNMHDGLTSWWTTAVDREGDVLLFDFTDVLEPFRPRRERPTRTGWCGPTPGPSRRTGPAPGSAGDLADQPDEPGAPGCCSGTAAGSRAARRASRWSPAPGPNCWCGSLDYVQSGKAQPYFVTARRHRRGVSGR